MIYNESIYNKKWETKKLSDLGDFSRGKSKHRPRNDPRLFEGGGYPLVQTGEIKDANLYITSHTQEYGEFGLKQSKIWGKDTLCITIAANIAETALLSYPMCFPDSVVGFRAYEGISTERFMYYIFSFIKNSIQNSVTGSTQDNINIDYLTSLDFKIPSKNDQDKIADILSTIDLKILSNNRINDNLQHQLKLIYDYWFTQFDFPDENGKPYRSSGGKMVWNEQLKCDIPVDWCCITLADILSKNTQQFDYKNILPTIDLSVMPSANIALSQVNTSDMFTTNLFIMTEGDLLFGGIRPYLRKAGIAPCNGVVTGTVHSYQVKDQNDYNFALSTITSDIIFDYAVSVSTGTKMPVISSDNLLAFKVPYSMEIAHKFNMVLNIKDTICKNIQENLRLNALRDWLLPMLMNGQATIAD